MKNFFPLYSLLAPTALGGFFLLLLVFAFCFLGVHVAKYAVLGWQQRNQTAKPPPSPAPPQKEAPTNPPEPVYYIVERKRRREKAKYSEPKEIRFK